MPAPAIEIRPTRHHAETCTPAERETAAKIAAACADKPIRRIRATADITARPLSFSCAAPVGARFTERKPTRALGQYQREREVASIMAIQKAITDGVCIATFIAQRIGLDDGTVRRLLRSNPDKFVKTLEYTPGKSCPARRWGLK